MGRVRKPSKEHRKTHFKRDNNNSLTHKARKFPKKSVLQRSLRVAGELFVKSKEKEELGIHLAADVIKQEGEVEVLQKEVQELKGQIQEQDRQHQQQQLQQSQQIQDLQLQVYFIKNR